MSQKNTIFSVLISVYNDEAYLIDCLNSVYGQTFKDFEVIIIDDGSTDSCPKICDIYKQQHSENTTIIHKSNEGILLARSFAMRAAKGQYFVFVDSDDTLRENALETIYRYLSDTDADMVIYEASRSTSYNKPYINLPFSDGEIFEGEKLIEIKRLIARNKSFNYLWIKAVKRDIADFEIDFDKYKDIQIQEDLVHSLPFINNAKKIVLCKQILYFYRLNKNSITNIFCESRYESSKKAELILKEYIDTWGNEELKKLYIARNIDDICDDIRWISRSRLTYKDKTKHYDYINNDQYFKFLCKYEPDIKLTYKRKIVFDLFKNKHYTLIDILYFMMKIYSLLYSFFNHSA